MADESKFYLGFDFSTQQIKLIAVDDNLKVVFDGHVKFDTDLQEFGTCGGAHLHDDKVTVTAPAIMWVKALDKLLDRMKSEGFDFSKVVGISGDGQQHGSVYWKNGARDVLRNMSPDKAMHEQLKDCFSLKDSPIWQDASTGSQIVQLQEAVGGAMELARLTGSRGFERYTGTQIMKIYQTNKEAYNNTERISLISSFAASLFIGDYAPIDFGDGSGMNLLDIRNKVWAGKCLEACGPCLSDKLGEPVPSDTIVGNVSSYMSRKYGFPSDCKVAAFTGDNMCSLAGLAPRKGDIMVSLGSSDDVFISLPEAKPRTDGHIFLNPLESNTFVGLVCLGTSDGLCTILEEIPSNINSYMFVKIMHDLRYRSGVGYYTLSLMVSLGSSDTVFLWLPEATPGTDGHIFVNPLESNTFMGLVCVTVQLTDLSTCLDKHFSQVYTFTISMGAADIIMMYSTKTPEEFNPCLNFLVINSEYYLVLIGFKNGSLTRENVMNRCAGSWEKFNDLLQKTPPGNNGNIGIYFDKKEIQPVVVGTFRFNEKDELVESFPPEVEIRAVLESQFLARLMYAKFCGLQIGPESRVIATGGASANPAILQVISDIFNTSVYVTDVPNSAALGGCYRAKHALMPEGTPYDEVVKDLPEPVCACKRTPGLEKVYVPMLERYQKLEERIAAM